ncbi:MAG TPA: hypothetical protein VF735_03320 [Pyrinomonadaceae bacterium]
MKTALIGHVGKGNSSLSGLSVGTSSYTTSSPDNSEAISLKAGKRWSGERSTAGAFGHTVR